MKSYHARPQDPPGQDSQTCATCIEDALKYPCFYATDRPPSDSPTVGFGNVAKHVKGNGGIAHISFLFPLNFSMDQIGAGNVFKESKGVKMTNL